jgi:hypothetical protein
MDASDVELAIFKHLDSKGLGFEQIDIEDDISKVIRTGMAVTINSGTFDTASVSFDIVYEKFQITLFVVALNANFKKGYRSALVHELIQTVIRELLGEDFDLPITGLKPLSYRDITSQVQGAHGKRVFKVELSSSYELEKDPIDKDSYPILEEIRGSYFLDAEKTTLVADDLLKREA